MHDEIQLISDGDGLAVIGESSAVDRFGQVRWRGV
jgi:hypothetical protein